MAAALGAQESKHLFNGVSDKTAVKTQVETPVKLLKLLEANLNMTLAEVAAEIDKSLRAFELASSKLVKEGRLRFVGPQKGGRWEVLNCAPSAYQSVLLGTVS